MPAKPNLILMRSCRFEIISCQRPRIFSVQINSQKMSLTEYFVQNKCTKSIFNNQGCLICGIFWTESNDVLIKLSVNGSIILIPKLVSLVSTCIQRRSAFLMQIGCLKPSQCPRKEVAYAMATDIFV